jgi:hypothetical protein
MANVHVDLTAKGGAEQIAAITRRNVAQVMQMATVEFYRQVIISTPVDTGRARNGWNITIQAPSMTVPPEGKYSMPNIEEHGLSTIISVTPEQVIYITNRVPYIENLNKGSSRQAPARFVELAAERVQRGIKALARSGGRGFTKGNYDRYKGKTKFKKP